MYGWETKAFPSMKAGQSRTVLCAIEMAEKVTKLILSHVGPAVGGISEDERQIRLISFTRFATNTLYSGPHSGSWGIPNQKFISKRNRIVDVPSFANGLSQWIFTARNRKWLNESNVTLRFVDKFVSTIVNGFSLRHQKDNSFLTTTFLSLMIRRSTLICHSDDRYW